MASEDPTRAVAGRLQTATPDLLRKLRKARVMVFHPKDGDGELLVQQLERIGCQVVSIWPPLDQLPDTVDLLICAVRPDFAATQCSWMSEDPALPIIAMISYENPTILDAVLRIGARSVLVSPLRSAGVLAALAMAKHAHEQVRDARQRTQRLEQKLRSVNQIAQAKAVLVRTRGTSDEEAYRIIREQAMSKRTTIEEIARAIIHADGILSFSRNKD